MSEKNELLEVVRATALNVRGVSEQMGVLTQAVKDVQKKQSEQAVFNQEVLDRMDKYENTIMVDRVQAQNIRRAIHKRAADVLGIKYDKYGNVEESSIYNDETYRGKFISRIYRDARKDSELGTPYAYTYRKDYEDVIEFIASWYPFEGVEGLKEYIDKRNAVRARQKRNKRD